MSEEQSQASTIMYTPLGSEWRVFGHPRNRRPLSSVVLPQNVSEELVADVQDFLNSSQWYIDRYIFYIFLFIYFYLFILINLLIYLIFINFN